MAGARGPLDDGLRLEVSLERTSDGCRDRADHTNHGRLGTLVRQPDRGHRRRAEAGGLDDARGCLDVLQGQKKTSSFGGGERGRLRARAARRTLPCCLSRGVCGVGAGAVQAGRPDRRRGLLARRQDDLPADLLQGAGIEPRGGRRSLHAGRGGRLHEPRQRRGRQRLLVEVEVRAGGGRRCSGFGRRCRHRSAAEEAQPCRRSATPTLRHARSQLDRRCLSLASFGFE
mmetsp:Transcript_72240/g.182128  ORF Transcript_72240/g.182128 Transcript_72240/m.182128 type:complete len:229 (-) Transcript_72240:451-1137(-)